MDFWDICTLLGVLLTAFSGVCAFVSAKLGLMTWRQMQRDEELSRACVGESVWSVENGVAYGKLKVHPGRHFVQTKAIKMPGYKLAYVIHSSATGTDRRYVRGDWLDVLPATESIPVNGGIVEMEFAVSSTPIVPFKVIVELARGEAPIEYEVVEDPEVRECDASSPDR